MSIIEHIEKFLGPVEFGWKDSSSDIGVQIGRFKNQPSKDVDTFTTLGLSKHKLELVDKKKVRLELLFMVEKVSSPPDIVCLLLWLSEMILQNHRALLRGQVIKLPREIEQTLKFHALYCTIPVFFEDQFATCFETIPPTVLVWVIPIFAGEEKFIDAYGWEKFEDLLESVNSNLFNLERTAVVQ